MINGRAKLKIWDVVCGRFMRMKNGIIRLLRFSSEDAWLPWFVDTSIGLVGWVGVGKSRAISTNEIIIVREQVLTVIYVKGK